MEEDFWIKLGEPSWPSPHFAGKPVGVGRRLLLTGGQASQSLVILPRHCHLVQSGLPSYNQQPPAITTTTTIAATATATAY